MERALQAVIFDFDGVVVNSEVIALKELRECISDLGVEIGESEMIASFLGASFEDIAAFARREIGHVDEDAFRSAWYDRLFKRYEQELAIMPGARDLFALLKSRGIPFCIASGGSYRRLDFALGLTGLADLFDGRAFSADSVSKGKPEPDVFLFAADKLGVPARNCLVVEDATAGVTAASKADMKVVGFVGGGHLEKCRAEHARRLEAAGAAATISRLADVMDFLPGH